MNRSLEQCAPRWIVGRITQKSCRCGRKFKRSNIVQIGIRKVRDREVLAVEVWCPNCKKGLLTTFSQEKDLRQLLCMMLEEIQKIDHLERSQSREKNRSRSKISDQEFTEFKELLNSSKTYSDLLAALGIKLDES